MYQSADFPLPVRCILLAMLEIFEYFTVGNARGSKVPGAILAVRQMVQFLKVSERMIYRLPMAGNIPSLNAGGYWHFQRCDLIQWMNEQARQNDRGSQPRGEKD